MEPSGSVSRSPVVRVLVSLLCLATTPTHAATLIWDSGTWGETWAATPTKVEGDGAVTLPPTLSGGSFNGPTDPAASSTATFALGLTSDNGRTWPTTAEVGNDVKIIGYIKPESAQIGQKADIYVVDRVNMGEFRMKNQSGVFVPWDARVPNLVPSLEDVTLTTDLAVDIFTGTLGVSGDHRFFIGYMASDGVLRYTPNALRLTITP